MIASGSSLQFIPVKLLDSHNLTGALSLYTELELANDGFT
jgi:hypothetical protein